VNFGLIYGMGVGGFQRYASSQYGMSLTADEAAVYRETFFRAYPGLARWHREVKQERQAETRTLCGRRRRLTDQTPDTQRLNTPVQGTGVDGLKRALALLYERRHRCASAVPVIVCHDEIVVECDIDQADAAAEWLSQAMKDGMGPLIAPVPVEVETQIGPTWS
jgi:DNA polymerase I-like protein with 3'-5' exonuclease and polymerase domains